MTNWLDLQERWMRDGNSCWFADGDEDGVEALERHLRQRRIPFTVRQRKDEAAVVFLPFQADEDDAAPKAA